MEAKMMSILEEAAMNGVITCPECGNLIEPDCEKCLLTSG
jgi:hypothetical protein